MIWRPERPDPAEAERWLDQLHDDREDFRDWEPDGYQEGNGRAAAGTGQEDSLPEAGRDAGGQAGDPLYQPVELTERAVIGDELRLPAVWCELAPCISRYTDPEALGEADSRARAARAGWREDQFGRLVCPTCQQTKHFWSTQPVIQWDREVAVSTTFLMAAAISGDAVGAAGAETGVLPAALPAPRPSPDAGSGLPAPPPAAAAAAGTCGHKRRRPLARRPLTPEAADTRAVDVPGHWRAGLADARDH